MSGRNSGAALVNIRCRSGAVREGLDWSTVPADCFGDAVPWRTFRWYQGQKHYSGFYWSATMRDHVIYESRLELARLLFADFDPAVTGIVAQPFLLKAEIDGVVRRHVPDFLLRTDAGVVVVDVKPAARVTRPKVAFALGWTARLVAARGWRYEVFSEPGAVRLENVRFLAGYRRTHLVDPLVVQALREADLVGGTLGQAFAALPDYPAAVVRAAVLHLVWSGHFTVDMDCPLWAGGALGGRR